MRSGTLDAAGIHAFAVAARRDRRRAGTSRPSGVMALRDRLIEGALALGLGITVERLLDRRRRHAAGCPATRTSSCPAARATPCSTCSTPPGSSASTGSACQAGVPQPSHVLLAMGAAGGRGARRAAALARPHLHRGRRRRVPAPPCRRSSSGPGGREACSDAGRRRDVRRGRLRGRRRPDARRRPRGGRRAPRAVAPAATLRESARGCCTIEDAGDARRVADRLGIPFYVWDLASRFRARRRRGLRRRVRRRPHAQPVPALQRADQVRRAARQGGGAGLRRRGDGPLRAGRRGSRRAARAAPGRRRRQGPVLRARGARRRAAGPRLLPARATRPSRRCARRPRRAGSRWRRSRTATTSASSPTATPAPG